MGGWRGGAWRLPLVVVALLTWLAGCGGDAAITGPPGFVAGYPRIERVGALTFVVAIRLDVPGAVDLVAASIVDEVEVVVELVAGESDQHLGAGDDLEVVVAQHQAEMFLRSGGAQAASGSEDGGGLAIEW